MEPEFWHERWENNLIGFHLDEVNPHLRAHWHSLAVSPGARVLVPLCGKSLDLVWLAGQGYEVIGVEVSPIAVKDFFAENHLRATRIENQRCDIWRGESITLLCGDLFALTAEDLGRDRCSLRPGFTDCSAAGPASALCRDPRYPGISHGPASAHYPGLRPRQNRRATLCRQ